MSLESSSTASSPRALFPKGQRTPLTGWLRRLKVGQKIGLGYGMALGIGIAGTALGIWVGDRYQRQAWRQETHAREEVSLLSTLQIAVLQTRTHQQQLIPLVRDRDAFQAEYQHLQAHQVDVLKAWRQAAAFIGEADHSDELHTTEMPAFLERYEGVSEDYFQALAAVLDRLDVETIDTPAEIQTAQRLLLDFTNSDVALRFDGISDDLLDLAKVSEAEMAAAFAIREAAYNLRRWIILLSIVISGAIATLLAICTSRAIVHPLTTATAIAQRVRHDADFSLKIPITTNDEVGELSKTLNQLIKRVKLLLTEQQNAAQQRLIQSEKMSSLGRMVAGVAHEINNPVNFIYGNLDHANQYIQDLFDLIHTYETEIPQPPDAVRDKAEDIDREFLEEDLPKLVQSMQVGAERIRQIVLSLRSFSRLDEADAHPVDLHECLESTLLILHNRIKQGVTITREFGDIPLVECYAGSMYQVFMNLLSNALDAMGNPETREPGQLAPEIRIVTERQGSDRVVIRIADNGPGISPENLDKIFETFFTTKPTGVGTGLGLSISRQIIEEKHGGRLICRSSPGQGAEFWIELPLRPPAPEPNSEIIFTPAMANPC
ncbi:ATP-binding protein [Geitlerinema sp. PCC 7407]|uniref:sensor histidine kinase n=1 Tax=Geitlerinema sp. PCC 7407 TaxID=1173025 RepID=UPI00029FD2DC|nr:ATP-binding protein [Geitlerinema sp. PCC 7407]AFY66213.1 integral membrane sensor signal transduction histidine kinase [Geitlerinema sp. PCC 7407]